MGHVSIQGLRKSYGSTEVIKGINLDIRDGEFLVFVGPSGCGKSTTLRMIAGLEDITAGDLQIDGVRCNDIHPSDRGAAMVFQSYALYPHMTVGENMGFALKMAGVDKTTRNQQVAQAAEILRITPLLDRLPKDLSGGQRQRVAIGRAIVRKPKVFLFDEPLSNLDAALRVNMRIELSRLHQELGTTMIYVTHDQTEAMTMGDRIAVFNQGVIEQVGAPLQMYNQPANLFVAGFLGSPRINLIQRPSAASSAAHQALWNDLAAQQPASVQTIGVRPEHIRLNTAADSLTTVGTPATVELAEHLGDVSIVHLRVEGLDELISAKISADHAHEQAGQTVGFSLQADAALAFDAQGKRLD